MAQELQKMNQSQIMELIQSTPATKLAALEMVKNRFIHNYNHCHKGKDGELMYQRQMMHFNQAIANSDGLKKCSPFSLYAVLMNAAVKGYSLAPEDDEVYLIPRGGKAVMQLQAGAHVKRLMRTSQITFANQVQLVFFGDDFEVSKGRVVRHIEKYQSEMIIAAYVTFVLDDKGTERDFVYRKADWQSWRAKSDLKNGDNWNGGTYTAPDGSAGKQPQPGFLRTKVMLHATKEKCWATGMTPAGAEHYDGVEVEIDDADHETLPTEPTAPQQPAAPPLTVIPPAEKPAGRKSFLRPKAAEVNEFDESTPAAEGVTVTTNGDDDADF